MRLDHVQLAIPKGSEASCRAFYCDLLGWREVEKPQVLAARGGLWLDIGEGQVHLGVEDDFRPARKAHPAMVVDDLDALAAKLRSAGVTVIFDDAIPGVRRFYANDPVGNRLEFVEAA
jgi:catechol 2,3-dioxygenase-like lactoylglutathione lyase family enzyme